MRESNQKAKTVILLQDKSIKRLQLWLSNYLSLLLRLGQLNGQTALGFLWLDVLIVIHVYDHDNRSLASLCCY